MNNIAYQNKDIASKMTSEALIGQSLAPFGLPHIKVIDILPTNLPAIEVNELRLDNLFLLEDNSVAIIDYESDYEKANFVKYINYAARVIRRYALSNRLSKLTKLRIIVIYTADISSACDCYDLVPRCINSRVNITRYPRPLHVCEARRRHHYAVASQTHR